MKLLRNFLDKIEPNFKEGGKLEFFYPFYEAMDFFFYNVGDTNTGRVHVRDSVDLKRNMILVKGSIPGSRGTDVIIRPAIKKS